MYIVFLSSCCNKVFSINFSVPLSAEVFPLVISEELLFFVLFFQVLELTCLSFVAELGVFYFHFYLIINFFSLNTQ